MQDNRHAFKELRRPISHGFVIIVFDSQEKHNRGCCMFLKMIHKHRYAFCTTALQLM